MNQDIFNGVIPSPYSPYDYSCRVMSAKEHAPEYKLDVRGKVYHQTVGNCVAQTARAFARIMTGREYGVDMMYGGARTDGRETSGLHTREAADFFVKNGIALLIDDPNETDVTEVITYWNKNKTKLCKVAELSGGTWYRVETIDEIKCALESGVPVWCAVAWYGYHPQYEGKGLLRYEPDKRPSGYHEMLIVGWKQCEDGERAIFLNSHGEDAGDEGYCYGKWEHVLALNDCIVMNAKKQEQENDVTPIVVQRTLRLKETRMQGDDVKELQELLNKHGIVCSIDGIFGPKTDEAVREFQKINGLSADGIVGKLTWAALKSEPEHTNDWLEIAKDMTMWLRIMVGWHYIIGAQGHQLTNSYLSERYKGHESYFTNGRLEWLRGEISRAESMGVNLYCADCSGLFFKVNEMMGILPIKDATANGLWAGYCIEIGKDDVRAGDILFRRSGGRMVHMAIVGEDGVCEAAGTAYGVVFRPWYDMYSRRTYNRMTGKFDTLKPWTHYGRLKVLV